MNVSPVPIPPPVRPITTSRPRPTWTVRVALWSARHRWPVMLAWFAITVGLFFASLGLGGIRAAGASTGAWTATESAQAAALMSAGGGGAGSEDVNVVISSATHRATDPTFRAVVDEVVTRLGAARAIVDGAAVPAVAGLVEPYTAPPASGTVSADLTAVRVVGRLDGDSRALEARARAIEPVLAAVQSEFPDFAIHAVSNTLLNDQMAVEINRDLDASLWISLPATFLILLAAFGALVAACVPLFFAITALLGAFGLFGLFSQTVEAVSPYAAQFIVLIGLAVAVDYSLFVITRFRSERRAGRDRFAAIEVASATSGRAVLFSGMAVTVSLAALFLLPDPMFQSIAIGTIAVITIAVTGSLAFLPAVLAILGDRINRGRIPFGARRAQDATGRWDRTVRAAMAHPIVATVAATGLLLVLAFPVTRLHLGESDIDAFPERIDSVAAVQALQSHWPQGSLLRLDVVLAGPATPTIGAAIDRLGPALLELPGLTGPVQRSTVRDGSATSVSLLMAGSQNDPSNWQLVRRVRETVVPAVLGPMTGVRALVGGGAAVSLDQTQIYSDGILRIFAFVLTLSFLLLLLVFHSIAIPLKAILLNLLATGAAFGAMVLVFQEGWLGGPLGVRPTDVIQDFVPVFVFTALFGLSMDYEVFILARVREAVDAGSSTRDAVERGISLTAGTVTSAAAVMVVVFLIFLTLPLPIARELGLGMAVAVLVDATIIRTVLLPATMRLLGEWNWWLPPFLRWLPRITIEGDVRAEESPAAHPGTATLLPSGTGVPAS